MISLTINFIGKKMTLTELIQHAAVICGIAALLWVIAGLLASPFEQEQDETEAEFPPAPKAPGLPHNRRKV